MAARVCWPFCALRELAAVPAGATGALAAGLAADAGVAAAAVAEAGEGWEGGMAQERTIVLFCRHRPLRRRAEGRFF
jgi:hypothetical protein